MVWINDGYFQGNCCHYLNAHKDQKILQMKLVQQTNPKLLIKKQKEGI